VHNVNPDVVRDHVARLHEAIEAEIVAEEARRVKQAEETQAALKRERLEQELRKAAERESARKSAASAAARVKAIEEKRRP
jgi:hypothetical protein